MRFLDRKQSRRIDGMRPSKRKRGLTLVEIMAALFVLGVSSVGLISGLMQTRRMAEGSIHQSTATTVANGYLEQLKSMPYNELALPNIPTVGIGGAAEPLAISSPVSDVETGEPSSDIINAKLIDLRQTPNHTADDMQMSFVLYIEDLVDPANGVGEAKRISLRYTYIFNDIGRRYVGGRVLYAIRSKI